MIYKTKYNFLIAGLSIICVLIALSCMGSIVHSSTIGDKANLEDQIAFTFNNEDTECVEGKKKAWAVFLLCFSAQKNCSQMFFEDYKTAQRQGFLGAERCARNLYALDDGRSLLQLHDFVC